MTIAYTGASGRPGSSLSVITAGLAMRVVSPSIPSRRDSPWCPCDRNTFSPRQPLRTARISYGRGAREQARSLHATEIDWQGATSSVTVEGVSAAS
jgi:hypothetical protein